MRLRLNIAAIFIAVGLGALAVILPYNAEALIPRPPYYHWIFLLFSLAGLAMLFVFGIAEEFEETDDAVGSSDRSILWRAVGLAFIASALASATFIGATALVDYLDRAVA